MNLLATLTLAAWLTLAGPMTSEAEPPGYIADFGPVTAGQGWLLAGGQLYWTETAGTRWRNITPTALRSAEISAAAFMPGGNGWLLTAVADAQGVARYVLARTPDGGRTWQQAPLDLYAPGEGGRHPGGLYLERLDTLTGWLVVKHLTSSNFSTGDLFSTVDGGQTWERLRLPLGEPVRFSSADIGYVSGGPTGREAYRTSDGGRTWEPVDFADAAFATLDGGPDVTVVQAREDVAWAMYARGECDRLARRCTLTEGLRRTIDGGRTWAELPLPASVATVTVYSLPRPAATAAVPATQAAIPAPRTRVMIGYGFDKCEVALPDQLQDWIVNSPYQAVNLYIGGAARACSNRALSADLLRQLARQGWSFIPTWVGPQAPCYPHPELKVRMSSDPAVAYWQGAGEAANAADVLAWLGLTEADGRGSIVYYDMESYDTTNVLCHEAVKSFVAGWTAQLHIRGELSGVYGTGPTLSGFANQSEPPDAIWAARWIRTYFDPLVTVWDVTGLSNDLWVNHQRLRQYTGGHIETWGSTSLNIDADVLDGIVAVFALPPLPPRAWLPFMHNGALLD